MDGKIPAGFLVPASSASTHASHTLLMQDRMGASSKLTPRQVISDMKWEGEMWISSEDLSRKRKRSVEGATTAQQVDGRPPKPADPVEENDNKKDKDVVPSRMRWEWSEDTAAWALQERRRQPLIGRFFSFAPIPTKQVELLATIVNQDACPIDDHFLRTELVPRTSRVSLRLLDWLVVDYARERNVAYRRFVPVLKREIIVVVHQLYCSLRDKWRRRRFDCFRRRHRVYFDLDGKTHSTTVAQLHFFYIAKMYGFLEYASENLESIKSHMRKTLTEVTDAKQKAKSNNKTYRRKPLVKKATSRVFVSDTPYKLSFEYETVMSSKPVV